MKIKSIKEDMYIGRKLFDPLRSKLAAAIKNGLDVDLCSDNVVLYLGASHGYTPWFIANLCRFVFAVEFSSYVVPKLIEVCEKVDNIAPILEDANKPLNYCRRVSGVDVVYQDIAQKNQLEIFLKNVSLYLRDEGVGYLVVKCGSIDVVRKSSEVFETVKAELEKHLKIAGYCSLEPYEKGHYMVKVVK